MCNILLPALPREILSNIFMYLNTNDLRNLMLTCKVIREIILKESTLWKYVSRGKLIIQRECGGSISWYNKSRMSHNWHKGIFKTSTIIQNKINFMPWVQLLNPNIMSVCFGSTLYCYFIDNCGYNKKLLWSINVPTAKRFDVRTNDISRFIFKKNMLICGNRDGSATLYELQENLNKKPNILRFIKNCHNFGEEEVSAVEKWQNCVVTASYNSPQLIFWNTGTNNDSDSKINKTFEIQECKGCKSLAVDLDETKIAVGLNGNSKPVCIDLISDKYLIAPEASCKASKHVVRDIQWYNENGIVYVTHSGLLQHLDIRTGNVTYETRDPFQSSLFCVKTNGDRAIVAGSAEYSRCVLFDIRSTNHVQMYFTQKKSSPIYSLDFDCSKLITAGDQRVAFVNFNVNASTTRPKDYSHIFQFVTN